MYPVVLVSKLGEFWSVSSNLKPTTLQLFSLQFILVIIWPIRNKWLYFRKYLKFLKKFGDLVKGENFSMSVWEGNKLFAYVASCARLDLWNNITNLFVCIKVVHRPTEFDPPEGSNWKWIKNQTIWWLWDQRWIFTFKFWWWWVSSSKIQPTQSNWWRNPNLVEIYQYRQDLHLAILDLHRIFVVLSIFLCASPCC